MERPGERGSFSRRGFLHASAGIAGALLLPASSSVVSHSLSSQEARYYHPLDKNKVQCELCPWACRIDPGKRGACQARENQNGKLVSLVYGQVAAFHNDPVEKKPFFHFLPGSQAASIATAACNVSCKFCQNYELAHRKPEEVASVRYTPENIVLAAQQAGSQSIAYTYNEPVVFTEFMMDIATAGKASGLFSVVVSNGFIREKPLRDLCKVIDAYKVDLKAFTESYYQDIVGGQLKPVLDTLVRLKEEGVWTEIVYLLVPTYNDSDKELKEACRWIRSNLGPDVPLHFSRFYPTFKLNNLPPTPVSILERAYQIGLESGLQYVYMGNVPGHPGENTVCPNCGKVVIDRTGFHINQNLIQNNQCSFCSHPIPGFWSAP